MRKKSQEKKKKNVSLQHYYWFWANQFSRTLLNSCSLPGLMSRGPRSVTSVIPTLWDFMDSSPAGSSVHGIFLTRILEWVAMPSLGIFPPQGSNLHLLHCRQILYRWAFQEASLGDHQAHNNVDIGRRSGIWSDRNVEISKSRGGRISERSALTCVNTTETLGFEEREPGWPGVPRQASYLYHYLVHKQVLKPLNAFVSSPENEDITVSPKRTVLKTWLG